jgi:osmotically-inducible protein OsmY
MLAVLLAGCDIIKGTQIEQAVTKALAADQRTSSFEFEVSFADGTVTITGEVFKPEDIEAVSEIAKAVKGVTNVVNNCHVPEPGSNMMQDGVLNTPYL